MFRSERVLALLAPRKINFMLQTDNSNAKVPQIIVEPLFVTGAIEMYIAAVAMNEYENELVIIL